MNESIILPILGSKGYFQLSAPFNAEIEVGQPYTCRSIRTIDEYFAQGEDPQAEYYTAKGLTQVEFTQDFSEGNPIIGLETEGGHWIYVPARYISGFPNIDGVAYHVISLVVSMPAIPVDRNLTSMKSDIIAVITNHLGIQPLVNESLSSKPVLVPMADHVTITANRETTRLNSVDSISTMEFLRQQNALLVQQNNILKSRLYDLSA